MNEERKEYQDLYSELRQYERRGIYIAIEGNMASPTQIVKAHMVKEESAFMRDYVLNEKGDVKELYFNHVEL